MKHFAFWFLLLFFSLKAFSQEKCASKYSTLIVDPDYKGSIKVFSKPGGKLIKSLKHNFKEEDFLIVEVNNENDSMFYGSLIYAISGNSVKGWVKKSPVIGIYVRNYGGHDLNLYQSPDKNSKAQATLTKYFPNLFQVVSCSNKWLKIQATINKKKYIGWIEPEMQCDNPYTSCNHLGDCWIFTLAMHTPE